MRRDERQSGLRHIVFGRSDEDEEVISELYEEKLSYNFISPPACLGCRRRFIAVVLKTEGNEKKTCWIGLFSQT